MNVDDNWTDYPHIQRVAFKDTFYDQVRCASVH